MAEFLRIGNDVVNTSAIAGVTFAEGGAATLYLLMPVGEQQQIELTVEQATALSVWLSQSDRVIDLDQAPAEPQTFAYQYDFRPAAGGRRSAFGRGEIPGRNK